MYNIILCSYNINIVADQENVTGEKNVILRSTRDKFYKHFKVKGKFMYTKLY